MYPHNNQASYTESGLEMCNRNNLFCFRVGALLAVAWEGGGAVGTFACIDDGIVRLNGPGLISLGSLQIPVPNTDHIDIRFDQVVAVAGINEIPPING